MVRLALAVVCRVALILTTAAVLTAFVLIVKVPLDCPAGIVIFDEGRDASVVLLLETVTVRPPLGALLESATVPVTGRPPTTSCGESETPVTVACDDAWSVPSGAPVHIGSVQPTRMTTKGPIA
jgi:hypothetical protein